MILIIKNPNLSFFKGPVIYFEDVIELVQYPILFNYHNEVVFILQQ